MHLDTQDSRFRKAIALADRSASWPKLRDQNGRCLGVAIPSSREGVYYKVTRSSCECQDAQRHPERACKHRIALEIAIVRAGEKSRPAADVIDGLAAMAHERGAAEYDRIFGNAYVDLPMGAPVR